MNTLLIVSFVIGAIVALFCFFSLKAKRAHAAFRKQDVESALKNLIAQDALSHDEFDLFIASPIRDAYLDSIRQRAITIVHQFPGTATQDISLEGMKEIEKLIYELQSHSSQHLSDLG